MSPRTLLLSVLGLLLPPLGDRSVMPAEDAAAASRREDERLLREHKVGEDAGALLAFFRKRTPTAEDRQEMQRLVERLGHRSFKHREQATRELENWGPAAVELLSATVRHGKDLEVARRAEQCLESIRKGSGLLLSSAAIRQLARLRPDGAIAALLAFIPHADDEFVQEEVLTALVELAKDASRQGPVREALTEAMPLRRAAAGYVLGRVADAKVRGEVTRLLKDAEPIVRFRAAQGLLVGREKNAVPALIELLGLPTSDLTWQAEELLLRVAGETETVPTLPRRKETAGKDGNVIQTVAFVAGETEEQARKEYRQRWVKWWEENSARVDLARLDDEPAQRGWTVVAQMSTSKVYEVDRQGKVRWTIDNLGGPIDALMLPGDRVLIAEHHGSKVTERNLQGAVLWEKKLDDRPVQVQRLPGGNTFICTYSAVLEVTREGREVYRHKPEGATGQLYAGHKLRNGRILCVTLDGRVMELDAANGKTIRSFLSGLSGCYSVQALPRGHMLLASYNEGKVHEIDPDGKVVWRYELASAYHAERLSNGNTLLSSHGGSRVVEVDRAGKLLGDFSTNAQNVWRVHRR